MEHRCLSPWKGAVAGGLITFAWIAISWMVLPFHNMTVSRFTDPAGIVNALQASAPRSGIYVLSNDPKGQSAPTDPFLFVSYDKNGCGSLGKMAILGLLVQMIGAFFWTWILGKIPGLTLKDSALYGAFFGLCVGVLGAASNWVWWKFPLPFTAMYVADAVIAWTLASMALSRCYAAACALPVKAATLALGFLLVAAPGAFAEDAPTTISTQDNALPRAKSPEAMATVMPGGPPGSSTAARMEAPAAAAQEPAAAPRPVRAPIVDPASVAPFANRPPEAAPQSEASWPEPAAPPRRNWKVIVFFGAGLLLLANALRSSYAARTSGPGK